jgi:histidinol phosphatase-like PHP family hydrolase
VDILGEGSLGYPDELLKELDSTVWSIHSRFGSAAGGSGKICRSELQVLQKIHGLFKR